MGKLPDKKSDQAFKDSGAHKPQRARSHSPNESAALATGLGTRPRVPWQFSAQKCFFTGQL